MLKYISTTYYNKNFTLNNSAIYMVAMLALYYVAILLQQEYLYSSEVLIESISSSTVGYENLDELLESKSNSDLFSYLVLPLYLLVQVLLIATCMNVGAILIHEEKGFAPLFRIALKGFIIFGAFYLLTVLVSLYVKGGVKIEDVKAYQSDFLSVFMWVDRAKVAHYLQPFLQAFDVQQFVFIAWLFYSTKHYLKTDWKNTSVFVLLTYVLPLVVLQTLFVLILINTY